LDKSKTTHIFVLSIKTNQNLQIMKTLDINTLIAIKVKYTPAEFYNRYVYFLPNMKNTFYSKGLSFTETLNKCLVAGIPGIYLPIL
jgi:hypothetical protein